MMAWAASAELSMPAQADIAGTAKEIAETATKEESSSEAATTRERRVGRIVATASLTLSTLQLRYRYPPSERLPYPARRCRLRASNWNTSPSSVTPE